MAVLKVPVILRKKIQQKTNMKLFFLSVSNKLFSFLQTGNITYKRDDSNVFNCKGTAWSKYSTASSILRYTA